MMIIVLVRWLSRSSSQRMVLMSRLLVGSSSSMISGSANSTCASSTRSFQLGATHDHRVQHRVILEGELVLAQLTEPLIGVDADIARARLKGAAQYLHQRRLARAIGPDQAVTIAAAELDRDILVQRLGPELHGDVGSRNQSGTSQTRLTLYRGRATKRGPIGQWTALR